MERYVLDVDTVRIGTVTVDASVLKSMVSSDENSQMRAFEDELTRILQQEKTSATNSAMIAIHLTVLLRYGLCCFHLCGNHCLQEVFLDSFENTSGTKVSLKHDSEKRELYIMIQRIDEDPPDKDNRVEFN